MMLSFPELITESVTARFDGETHVAYVIYLGSIGADASTAAYKWLQDLLDTIGVESLYGEIWDFSKVTQFLPDNLIDARKNSRKFNLVTQNIERIPVAMVVRDYIQEEILRGPMRNVEENKRKRICHSNDEALRFIQQWRMNNTAKSASAE
ncbi:MAG: hypothetical protein ACOYLB_00160 [Phototrophicaceae bacterium]